MIESLITIGIPVLFLLTYPQAKFFQSFQQLVVISFSMYIALWSYPLFSGIITGFIPKEFSAYRAAASIAIPAAVCFGVLTRVFSELASHGGGGYHLPRKKNLLIAIPVVLTGFVVSGAVGYLICITPLHSMAVKDTKLAQSSVTRLNIMTGIIDSFSLQGLKPASRRKTLMSRVTKLKTEQKDKNAKQPSPAENNKSKASADTSRKPGPAVPAVSSQAPVKLEGEEWGTDEQKNAASPEAEYSATTNSITGSVK